MAKMLPFLSLFHHNFGCHGLLWESAAHAQSLDIYKVGLKQFWPLPNFNHVRRGGGGGGGGPKRPSWDQKWPNMATLPMSQSGLKGSKIIPYDQYNMILTIWHHFGPIWTLLDHFRQNLIFCSKVVLAKKHFLFCRQRIKFFLK